MCGYEGHSHDTVHLHNTGLENVDKETIGWMIYGEATDGWKSKFFEPATKNRILHRILKRQECSI